MGLDTRRKWIESPEEALLSLSKQCNLIGLPRSTYYYQPVPESEFNLMLMRLIDKQYLKTPFYGSRTMTQELRFKGYDVNRKRVIRLMTNMGIKAMVPGPHTSRGRKEHKKYPYLLKGLNINHCNQVWATDITYIPTHEGYLYLVAILDWYSRYILSWRLSNSLQSDFCVSALVEAFRFGTPKIFNTDQGVQFTSHCFTEELSSRSIQISMDGKGHFWDNIMVERLWRTIKYEEVYLKNYETGADAYSGLEWYIPFYNEKRRHTALNHRSPAEIYKFIA